MLNQFLPFQLPKKIATSMASLLLASIGCLSIISCSTVKEYQKKAEEAKRRENDSLGIQVHTVLTKENLKQWVEEEGRTYAWVAREKAGCADTQVAATAQMMGIKSKISKKRGMIMSGN